MMWPVERVRDGKTGPIIDHCRVREGAIRYTSFI